MRHVRLLLVDCLLIVVATLLAVVLRESEATSLTRLEQFGPFLAATALSALLLIPLTGLPRSIWRLTRLPDYVRVVLAVLLVVASASLITFAYNRLLYVPRSLPVLQAMVALSLLVGARVIARLNYSRRLTRVRQLESSEASAASAMRSVLLVGVGPLTEMYLQAIADMSAQDVSVVGLLGSNERHIGRLAGNKPVLGLPENIESVIADLEVHGINVDCIVVTVPMDRLSEEARDALLRLQRSAEIELRFISEDMGLTGMARRSAEAARSGDTGGVWFAIHPVDLDAIAARPYWRMKRAIDIIASAALILVLAPVFVLVAALVALSVGFPVTFWQQRPGLAGRPFRLFKFRTMRAARNTEGLALSDDERVSRIGSFLRRVRLDELPQLLNILLGHMSFVGPRPLLPRDQPSAYRARLLVRPGLTGWAQVVGGRAISAEDKAALDVWYVRNASLRLDIEIAVRTVIMVLFGERTHDQLISSAWQDLADNGIIKGELRQSVRERLHLAR